MAVPVSETAVPSRVRARSARSKPLTAVVNSIVIASTASSRGSGETLTMSARSEGPMAIASRAAAALAWPPVATRPLSD